MIDPDYVLASDYDTLAALTTQLAAAIQTLGILAHTPECDAAIGDFLRWQNLPRPQRKFGPVT